MTETWLILALAVACLGLVATCLYLWRTRSDYVRSVVALNREILEAAEVATFGKRVSLPASDVPEIGQLGDNVNRLFDSLNTKDRQMRQREALFQDLANTMPEVVLVHRDRVIFANNAAGALMGLTAEQLAGRPVTDLVRPAYRAMTRKNIAGRLAGEAVPDRYEIQLISGAEGGLWVEAAGTMIDYRGQKAILSIARDVSYYTYFIIENGGAAMGIEDAWVQFSSIFGAPLDLWVGQFQICDPIVRRELRLTREDYEVLRVRPGLAKNDLTYDRGLILGWHAPANLDLLVMVTNGNGIGPGAATFDDDRYKTFSLRPQILIGPFNFGLFGSVGKAIGGTAGQVNTTVYWGPDLSVEIGENLTVSGQWLSRHDSNAFFDLASTPETVTRGGWLEAVWLPAGPNGPFSVAVLANKVVSDDPAAERESAGLHAGYLYRRNVRLVAEARYDWLIEEARFSLGTVVAF